MENLNLNKTTTSKNSDAGLIERIQKKAKEIWERKGHAQNKDLDNWLEAERFVKNNKV